jgi:HD-GYP domain-containing protein (c-di-GMP phosphodiesterase class II)/putative methionine-R-sulfoxide reductase with GAF domain
MMTAKARGKSRIVVFHEDEGERPDTPSGSHDNGRSIAHLKMLHGATSKLTRLVDVGEIGSTVADELRQLIDYHNCRVFVRDGDDLTPIAFRGEFSAAPNSTMEALATKVGVGITGHVAQTGEPFLTGDAANCGIGQHIAGTVQIEESLVAVPLLHGSTVVGLIVISKLGRDQFDADDVRLLEVLAGHASVAVVNAQLYEAQRREAESAKALLEFTREISSVTDLDELVERIAIGAARLLGSSRASLWLSVHATGELECRAAWDEGREQPPLIPGDRLPRSVAEALVSSSEPFVLARETVSALAAGDLTPGLEESLCTLSAVAPLTAGSEWGALAVAIEEAEAFDDRQRKLLAGIAAQAKLALATALSFERLERTFLSTVEALTNALEAKDEYTSSHARWIRDMSVKVGEELGLGQEALKRVELGALFHDIGKIGIPAAILTKPGPLTDKERELVETHPELGERILAPIEQLEDVRPIVRACHERFDGQGYPDRLAGKEIPLEARIIFACDAFHAMTTDRPYRQALAVEEAQRRLVAAAGSQFDPEIVQVCLRVLEAPQ